MNRKKSKVNVWTSREIKELKRMSKEGMTSREIAHELGRTTNAVGLRKSILGIKSVRVKINKGKGLVDKSVSVKEPEMRVGIKDDAKALSRVAREIARRNGKRIVMSMFFVEDL